MGLYDRDYIRDRPSANSGAIGSMRMWSVNTWIIALCIAVFVLDFLTRRVYRTPFGYEIQRPLLDWLCFSVGSGVLHLQIWRFITFQFVHQDFNHILFNMIALYFFGPMIESYLGSRRFLIFYLLCGIAGPIMYMVFWALGFMIQDANVQMVGASAGIFGVLVAAALLAPNATVLIYGIFPMKLKVMALLLLAIAAYTVWTGGPNAGGEAAHLGGAAMGFALIRNQHWLNLLDFGGRGRRFATRL